MYLYNPSKTELMNLIKSIMIPDAFLPPLSFIIRFYLDNI